RLAHGDRALGALDHAVAREAARGRARLGHGPEIDPGPPAAQASASALHGQRELAAVARAGPGLPLRPRAPPRAHHADGVLQTDAGRAAKALERGAQREQLRIAAPEHGHALHTPPARHAPA